MDEAMIMIALAPFYIMGVTGAAFTVAYMVRAFMDSATEVQMKETLQTPK